MVYPTAVVGPNDPKATGRYIKNLASRKMPAQVLTKAPFSFVYVGDVCAAIIQALEKMDNLGEKYLVNGSNLTFGQINQLVSEIAGIKLPLIHFPDTVTIINAKLLTWLSKLTGKPPWLDLSVDQVSLMKQGFKVDGSKAERELGIHYTPIRVALQEAIAAS
jgi:dihydroflavonol-4-reductase